MNSSAFLDWRNKNEIRRFIGELIKLTYKQRSVEVAVKDKKGHVFKVDKFIVPFPVRDIFLTKVHETHALLKEQPGFIRDFILEKSSGPGEFNVVTLVEWKSSEAIEIAKQVIKEIHHKKGFNPSEFQKQHGIKSDIADFHETRN